MGGVLPAVGVVAGQEASVAPFPGMVAVGPCQSPLPAQCWLCSVPAACRGFYAPAQGWRGGGWNRGGPWGLEHGPLAQPAFMP